MATIKLRRAATAGASLAYGEMAIGGNELYFGNSSNIPIQLSKVGHGHAIADVTGLQTALDSKLTSTNDLSESYLIWGGRSLSGQVTPIGMSLSNEHSANRLAFINGDSLYFEYSSDGGSTWVDYGYNATTKTQFCTTSVGVPVGRNNGSAEYTVLSRTRVTLTAQNGTTGYVYTNPRKMLINISSSGGMQVLVETRTGTNYQAGGAWTTFGTYNLSGWSGWNDIPLVLGTLGGGTTQTGNNWQLRLTFIMTSKNNDYPTTAAVSSIRIYGENAWSAPSTMAATNNLYSFDMSQNATFPANLTATSLTANGTMSLRASALGSTPTHFLILNGDPSSTTRTVQTRTPSQILSDIGALSTSGGTVNGKILSYTNNTTGTYDTRSIELREVGFVEASQSASNYAPALAFHWGGRVQTQIALLSNGKLVVRGDSGDGSAIILEGDSRLSDARTPLAHTHPYSDLTGTVPTWNQNTTGNAATATKLAAAVNINGVAFDGSTAITITAAPTSHSHGNLTNDGRIGSAPDLVVVTGTNGALTVQSRSGIDSRSTFPAAAHAMTLHTATAWRTFFSNGSGALNELAFGADGTYLRSSGASAAPTWATIQYSELGGTIPTWNQSTTGNAATATKLAAPVNINGVAFDGSTAITITAAPTSHTHGNISNDGKIGSVPDLVVVTGTNGELTIQSRSGIDSRTAFPTAQHTIASHSATAWRMFYSNATTTAVQELAFGAAGTYLRSAGASAVPTWATIQYSELGGTVPIWNQSTTGNAATATKLAAPVNINGVSFDGSASITIYDGSKLSLNGGTLQGDLTLAKDGSTEVGSQGIIFQANTAGSDFLRELNIDKTGVLKFNGTNISLAGHMHTYADLTGTVPTWNQSTTGNAATATTAVTANAWTTARTLTIGSSAQSIDGSGNVTYTLASIGAAATSHTHGDISSTGLISAQTSMGTGDAILLADSSDSGKVIKSDITLDTTNTTHFLRRDGAWVAPSMNAPVTSVNGYTGAVNTVNNTLTTSTVNSLVYGVLQGTAVVQTSSGTRLKIDTGFYNPQGGSTGNSITFNVSFTQRPAVFAFPVRASSTTATLVAAKATAVSTTGATFISSFISSTATYTPSNTNETYCWVAIGY